ncbi:UDP-glucose 4-epimerase, partial [Dethiosulfovibrio sp. F2B]|nr:UDP-glucose 4-epimerase [Dethiosulfovibrio faecalis]
MKRIVVTGGLGQIGTELIRRLRKEYGSDCVLAT